MLFAHAQCSKRTSRKSTKFKKCTSDKKSRTVRICHYACVHNVRARAQEAGHALSTGSVNISKGCLDSDYSCVAAPLRGGEMATSSDVRTQEELDQLLVSPFSIALMFIMSVFVRVPIEMSITACRVPRGRE